LRDLKLNVRRVFERSSNSASRKKKVLRFSNPVIVEDEISRDP